MDNYKQLIIIKGEPKDDIIRCYYDKVKKKQAVVFNNNPTTYYYSYNNVKFPEAYPYHVIPIINIFDIFYSQ